MAKVTNIDELLPEDIELVYKGTTYTIPGDIQIPDVLSLFLMIQKMSATNPAEVTEAQAKKQFETIETGLLKILNLDRIEKGEELLTRNPFGTRGLGIACAKILEHLVPEIFDPGAADPNPKAPVPVRKPPVKRSSTLKRKSSLSSPRKPRASRSPRSTG